MALEETLSLNVEFEDLDRLQAELGESVRALGQLGAAAQQASLGFDKLTGAAAQSSSIGDQFARNFKNVRIPKLKAPEFEPFKIPPIGQLPGLGLSPQAQRASDKVQRDLDRIGKAFEKTSAQAKRSGTGIESFFQKFTFSGASILRMTSALVLAEVGMRSFGQALNQVTDFFKDSVRGAAAEEEGIAKLANAFALTGNASAGLVEDTRAFAEAIARTTTFTDDQVVSVAALLAQFGKLKGIQLREATKTTLDLAVALGKSSDEIAEIIAKAAQGNLSGLGRLIGRDAIENAKSFNDVLKQLNQTVGGTAAAAAATSAGSLKQMANAFGELKDAIGNAILPGIGGFAKSVTGFLDTLTRRLQGLATTTIATVPEMVQAFSLGLAQMDAATSDVKKKIQASLIQLQDTALTQLRFEIEHGDVDAALATLGQIDDVVVQSTNAGNAKFQEFIANLKATGREAIPVSIELRTKQLENDFQKMLRELRGEESLEMLLKGTFDSQEAESDLATFRAAQEGKPLVIPIQAPLASLTELDAEIARLQDRLSAAAAVRPVTQESIDSVIALRKEMEQLRIERDKVAAQFREQLQTQQVTFSFQAPGELAADLKKQTDAAVEKAGTEKLRAEIRLRINAANSESELRAILADLKKQHIELKAEPNKASMLAAVDTVALEAQRLIASKKDLLKAPIGLEFVKPKDLAFESALKPFLDLIQKVQEAAGAAPGEIIDTAALIRDAEDATDALVPFSAALDAALERRDLSGLTATADAMEQFIRATAEAAGSDKALQSLRASIEKALAGIRAEIDKAGPLFKLQDLVVRIHAELDAGDIQKAEELQDRIKTLLGEHPELVPRLNLLALQNDIDRAKALAGPLGDVFNLQAKIDIQLSTGDIQGALATKAELERILELHPEIKPQVDATALFDALLKAKGLTEEFAFAMQSVDAAIGVTTTALTSGFQAAADQVKKIITDLVVFIIKKLAAAAILNLIFPGLGGVGSIFRSLIGFGKTAPPIPVPVIPTPVGKLSLPPVDLPVIPPPPIANFKLPDLRPVVVTFQVPDLPTLALAPIAVPDIQPLVVAIGKVPDLPTLALDLPEVPEIPGVRVALPEIPELPALTLEAPEIPPLPELPALVIAPPEIPDIQAPKVLPPDVPEVPPLTLEAPEAPRISPVLVTVLPPEIPAPPTLEILAPDLPELPDLVLGILPPEIPDIPALQVTIGAIPDLPSLQIEVDTIPALPEPPALVLEPPTLPALPPLGVAVGDLPELPELVIQAPEIPGLPPLQILAPDLPDVPPLVLELVPFDLPAVPPVEVGFADLPDLPAIQLSVEPPDVPDVDPVAVAFAPLAVPDVPALEIRLGRLPEIPDLELGTPDLPDLPALQVALEFIEPDLPEIAPVQVPLSFETPQIPDFRLPRLSFPEFTPPDLTGVLSQFGQAPRVVLPTQDFSRNAAREAAVRVAPPAPTPRPEPESILRRRSGADVEVRFEGTFDGESVRRQLQSGTMNRELLRIARRGRL